MGLVHGRAILTTLLSANHTLIKNVIERIPASRQIDTFGVSPSAKFYQAGVSCVVQWVASKTWLAMTRRTFPRIRIYSLIKEQIEWFNQDFKDVYMYLKALIEDPTLGALTT